MKKLVALCALTMLAYLARSSSLAFIVLDVADTTGRLPSGWSIKVNRGSPDVSSCSDDIGPCLRLRSDRSSFSLERAVDVDPARLPYLTWRWKVDRLPEGGDFRRASTDDQAAQLLVAFADRRVISYIWDTTAPKGSEQRVGFIPLLRVYAVVCQSGAADLSRWVAESRNVADDYRRAYGRPAPNIKGLRVQINSQHTGTVAESSFGDVAFRAAAQ